MNSMEEVDVMMIDGLMAGSMLANVGTPLMMTWLLHLVFGNLAIGMVEGAILAWVFRARWWKAMGWMILANYMSAWLGLILLDGMGSLMMMEPINLYNVVRWHWFLLIGAYLATIVLEYPFVWLTSGKRIRRGGKVLGASVLVQTMTYGVMVGWYWGLSGMPLIRENQVVQPAAMQMPAGVVVYYLGMDDGDLYELPLDTMVARNVMDLESDKRAWEWLLTQLLPNGTWELVRVRQAALTEVKPLIQGFARQQVPYYFVDNTELTDAREMSVGYFGSVQKLGKALTSDWTFRYGVWARDGLSGEQKTDGQRRRIYIETPFAMWEISNGTQLPDGKVLFELGGSQICLYDVNTRQVAMIARGHGPIAILTVEAARMQGATRPAASGLPAMNQP